MSRIHLLLLLNLALYSSIFLILIDGRPMCGSSDSNGSTTPSDVYDQSLQDSSDSIDALGNIHLSCETTGAGLGGDSVGSGSGGYAGALLGFLILLILVVSITVGTCCFCIHSRKRSTEAISNSNATLPADSRATWIPGEVKGGPSPTSYGSYQKPYAATMHMQAGQPN